MPCARCYADGPPEGAPLSRRFRKARGRPYRKAFALPHHQPRPTTDGEGSPARRTKSRGLEHCRGSPPPIPVAEQKLTAAGNEELLAEIDRRAHNKKVKRLLARHGIPEAA